MTKLAIIPARSGSRGLKDKNILNLCGKPVLAYSIEAALESECFDRVIVSTDSSRYGEIAESYGAEYMFRDSALADSNVPTFAVVKDVLLRIDDLVDTFTLLQPTSPMRTSRHILEAMQLFETNKETYSFVVSVSLSEHSSELVKPLAADGSLAAFNSDFSNYKRQVSKDYSPNGAIFIANTNAYLLQGHFFGPRSLAYVMSKEDSIDIDDEIDFSLAEVRMSGRLERVKDD